MKLRDIMETRFSPVVYFGDKDRPRLEYIYSRGDLNKAIKQKLGKIGISIENIVNLFAEHNMVVSDSIEFEFDVKELKQFREYDRKIIQGYTGKRTAEEMAELEADIRKHGITDHSVLVLDRQPNGDVLVHLGEGNHRLALAQKLGIRKMPVRLYYKK